jgi:hypothetical protein
MTYLQLLPDIKIRYPIEDEEAKQIRKDLL